MFDAYSLICCLAYLSDISVQTALHVSEALVYPWTVCSDPVFDKWSLTDEYADTTPLYSKVEQHPRKPSDFKILVYSGDVDGVLTALNTYKFTILNDTISS